MTEWNDKSASPALDAALHAHMEWHGPVRPYSSDTKAALEALERYAGCWPEPKDACQAQLTYDASTGAWECEITGYDVQDGRYWELRGTSADDDGVELAICRALFCCVDA